MCERERESEREGGREGDGERLVLKQSLTKNIYKFVVGFSLPIVKWIMGCVTSSSFAILINGAGSYVLRPLEVYPKGLLYLHTSCYWWPRVYSISRPLLVGGGRFE